MSIKPPVAEKREHVHTDHGLERLDQYHWLKDRTDPATIAYLEAENAHTEASQGHLADLRQTLYDEMLGRIVEDDTSAPYPRHGFVYYSRTVSGKPYTIYCRRRDAPDAEEEVILDVNALGEGQEYIKLSAIAVSPDQRYIAWLQDDDGAERFRLRVRDLSTGEILSEEVTKCKWGLTFAADNRTVLYTRSDHAQRPFQVWRHDIHSSADDDVLIYEEADERFFLGVGLTRDERYLVVSAGSKVTSEIRVIDAANPQSAPVLVWPRQEKVEASLSHSGGTFYFRTNLDATNFRLLARPAAEPDATLEEVIAHREDVLLKDVDAFARHLALTEYANGLPRIAIVRIADGQRHTIDFPDPTYDLSPSRNAEWDTDTFRFEYSSLAQPDATFAYGMESRERTLVKEKPVGGGFDRSRYVVDRLWATAADGERIPISMVRLAGVEPDGNNPTQLIGYGSYGYSYPAYFSTSRLSLVERGMIVAIAHIRGGSEMGRRWYEDGKGFHKMNTFTDFIAAAEHLVSEGWTSPSKLSIQGGSAGGLLMGAVSNMRPDLFAAVVAQVPFVDAVNTMMDASLPLTVTEYDEWGNPNEREVFDFMLTYSPYDNVSAKGYPAMFVSAGLNDPRVGYWEPAKWVARLRATRTDDHTMCLRTFMGAGHGGQSGRYGQLKDLSYVYSFAIDQLGADTAPRQ
ncbi:MAG: oligopeptidase B [Myxococcota bacterium]|jgi:oligopeptidase B